jgi:glycine/D-amino acid oxidase-like deaminating enzyme
MNGPSTAVDVAVVGLGAMGSAALLHLSRRGLRAIGIEQFEPGHDRGSSHGETRIIRLGYFEHPSYVPLVRSALALWRALEHDSGRSLLHVTGIIEIGPPGGTLVTGTLRSARTHGLAHEVLDAASVMRRFPAFRLPPDFVGVLQPEAGILAPNPPSKRRSHSRARPARTCARTSACTRSSRHRPACASSPTAPSSRPGRQWSRPGHGFRDFSPASRFRCA